MGYPWMNGTRKKYRNTKVEIDGKKFDSQKEATKYLELKHEQDAGRIFWFEHHVVFELVPRLEKDENGPAERAVKYEADFVVYDKERRIVRVYDVKSPITRKLRDYIIKRKLMRQRYGIAITEV